MVFYECFVIAKPFVRKFLWNKLWTDPSRILPNLRDTLLTLVRILFPPLLPADFSDLTDLMKKISHEVVKGGGIVRGIHNHGVRSLPQKYRARLPDPDGNRHFMKGRYISVYYDSSPNVVEEVDYLLTFNEHIVRFSHLRARSTLDYLSIGKEWENPYIQQVLSERLQNEEEKEQEEDETPVDNVEQIEQNAGSSEVTPDDVAAQTEPEDNK